MTHSFTFDITNPTDNNFAGDGDDKIIENQKAIKERLELEHWMNGKLNTDEPDAEGRHKQITMKALSDDPAAMSEAGIVYTKVPVISIVGDITSGSAIITNIENTNSLFEGMSITGSGIPDGTTIDSIDSLTQLTMTANATATTEDVELECTGTYPELFFRNPDNIYQITNGGVINPEILKRQYNNITLGSSIWGFTPDVYTNISFTSSEVTKTITITEAGAYVFDIGDYPAGGRTNYTGTQVGYIRLYDLDDNLLLNKTLGDSVTVSLRQIYYLASGIYTIKCKPHIYQYVAPGYPDPGHYWCPFRVAIANIFTIGSTEKIIPVIA